MEWRNDAVWQELHPTEQQFLDKWATYLEEEKYYPSTFTTLAAYLDQDTIAHYVNTNQHVVAFFTDHFQIGQLQALIDLLELSGHSTSLVVKKVRRLLRSDENAFLNSAAPRPWWDSARRQLHFKRIVLFQLDTRATVQAAILAAFQNANWRDQLVATRELGDRKSIRNAAYNLTARQDQLSFEVSGACTISWRPIEVAAK